MNKKYQIIYADPPWKYWHWCMGTGGGRSPEQHYPVMELGDICALPIKEIADRDCILFLWATFPKLPEALTVISAWGFEYKATAFVYVKLNQNNMGFFQGLGYWTRCNAEPCLLATKGHPKRMAKDVPQIEAVPRMAHSRKPDEIVRDRILRLVGDLSRIELFARRKVTGWDCWGNEVESDIKLGAI